MALGINLSEDSVARLESSLARLREHLTADTLAPGALVNPLLDVWAAAHDIHPWVSLPVERLLTVIQSRSSIDAPEVRCAADEVSLLLLEIRSLAMKRPARSASAHP
jgi:hypothetical protein